jgi:LPXTG-motif cell wall-anchored protein
LATPTLATTAPEAGELPQTGLSVWGVAIAVLGMLGLLVVARRLRTA